MVRMLKIVLMLLCASLSLSAEIESDALWTAGEGGYATYRIPGIVVTKRNTVLAYAVGRRTLGSDWADADVLMRRSTDGGRTFDAARRIAGGGAGTTDNPTAIVDRKSGAVYMVYQQDYARCYFIRSMDDGQTFSEPVDITYAFERFRPEYPWTVLAPGPGHALVSHSGRIVVPVWLAAGKSAAAGAPRPHHPSAVATIYSDDHGKTWNRGEMVAVNGGEYANPSETAIVERPDGSIVLNMRNESGRHRRLSAASPDGATHWSRPRFIDDLFEPVCAAGLVRETARRGRKAPLLFSNPDSEQFGVLGNRISYPRKRLTIQASLDEGESWPYARVLDEGAAGYSDLAVLADGTVLCLYEAGTVSAGHSDPLHITLARFSLGWVTGGGN